MPPRRIPQHFDVVVLGRATGGLVAAALLAKTGLQVAIIASPPASPAPWRHPVYVPSQAVAVRRVLERLGLLWARHPSTRRPASRQLVLPQHRLSVPYGQQATLAALSAEWPGLQGPLTSFYERLHRLNGLCERVVADEPQLLWPTRWGQLTQSFRLRRSRRFGVPIDPMLVDTLFGGIAIDHPLRSVLSAPLAALTQRSPRPSYFAAIRALHRYWCEEPWTLGEAKAPVSALWDAARMHNGQWWPQAVQTVYVTKRRRMGDIVVAGPNQVASGQFVLWNWGEEEQPPCVRDEQNEPWAFAPARPLATPTSAAAVFVIQGDRDRLPVGLAAQTTLPAAAHHQRTWRLMRMEPEESHAGIALVARAYGTQPTAQSVEELRAIVSDLAPVFAETCEIEAVSPVLDAPASPWDGQLPDVGLLGVQSHRMRTPFSNVVCTQDSVAPVLGIEGAFWVGWGAAEQIERRLRPRRPVLRRWQPQLDAAL